MIRGDDAGLEDSLAVGRSRNTVCMAYGEGGRLNGTGCCLRGDRAIDRGRVFVEVRVLSMIVSRCTGRLKSIDGTSTRI